MLLVRHRHSFAMLVGAAATSNILDGFEDMPKPNKPSSYLLDIPKKLVLTNSTHVTVAEILADKGVECHCYNYENVKQGGQQL